MSDARFDVVAGLVIKPTPEQRLSATRAELVRQMCGDRAPPSEDVSQDVAEGGQRETKNKGTPPRSDALGAWSVLKLGLGAWWRHHPGNVAVSVAMPLLGRYARRKPFQLIAISACVGAAVVVTKPWRLISLGGLAVAALKSSELSNMVASLLTSSDNSKTANNVHDDF